MSEAATCNGTDTAQGRRSLAAQARQADTGPMKLFRRKVETRGGQAFGPWLVRQLADGTSPADMRLAELEQLCSNAAAVMCGAAFGDPETASTLFRGNGEARAEAELVAALVGNAFDAPLEERDPENMVVSWPWDRMGVRAAVRAQDHGLLDEDDLGQWLMEVAGAYTSNYRAQAQAALSLWEEIAARAQPEPSAGSEPPPSLTTMGRQLLGAFQLMELAGTVEAATGAARAEGS